MKSDSIKTLVHLGSGYCTEMSQYLQDGYKKIILVEGDKEIADQLNDEYAASKQVQVIHALVGCKTDPQSFYRFSLTDANSLYPPTALYQHFPSIRLLSDSVCSVEAVNVVLDRLELDSANSVLVLDIPGIAFEVLQYLENKGYLQIFSALRVYINSEPLYEGETEPQLFVNWLEKQGFEITEIDQQDIERPCYKLKRSQHYLNSQSLAAKLKQITSDNTALSEEITHLKQDKARLESNEADYQALKKKHQMLNEQLKALNAEQDKAALVNAKLEAQLKEKEVLSVELIDKVSQFEKKLELKSNESEGFKNELAKVQKEYKDQRDHFNQAKKTVEADIARLNSELNEAHSAIELLREENSSLQGKLKEISAEKERVQEFFLSRKKQAEQAEVTIKALTEEKDSISSKYKSSKQQLDTLSKEAEMLKASASNLGEEKQALLKRRDQLKKELDVANQQITVLEEQVNHLQKQQQNQESLLQRMEFLFDQSRLQLEQATNALGHHISQTGRQSTAEIQTYIQYQKELGQTSHVLFYQDQQLSPERALLLKNKITQQKHDLILTIGSDISAHFLAVQLRGALQQNQRLSQDSSTSEPRYLVPDEGDLPKRILAFEHKKSNCKELKKHLEEQGLGDWVNVQLAPLVDCRFTGQDFLFYDLRKSLARIADVYEDRVAKILVIFSIENDIESITPMACMYALIKELACHQLELLVYPGSVDNAKELKENWMSALQTREIEFRVVEDTKADALIFNINT